MDEKGKQAAQGQEARKPWILKEFSGKTVWDWLQLLSALAIPVVLASLGIYFQVQLEDRQSKIEDRRAKLERELEVQRTQDAALQAYLDQMSTLLLEKDLRDDKVRTLLRARTLTVLGRLDPSRKKQLMRFIYEADLISRPNPVIKLQGVNLQAVNLSGVDLSGGPFGPFDVDEVGDICATVPGSLDLDFYGPCTPGDGFIGTDTASTNGINLSQANLRNANLHSALLAEADLRNASLEDASLRDALLVDAELYDANLSHADLSGANLKGADLSFANLTDVTGITKEELEQQACTLDGAIMPDGSEHPYARKPINCEQERPGGENGDNTGPS
jgi:uncharacterized protein YjbI with pentapeptide repeats